jgi:ABC-type multidrug transport system fused ATPase/permease subunit
LGIRKFCARFAVIARVVNLLFTLASKGVIWTVITKIYISLVPAFISFTVFRFINTIEDKRFSELTHMIPIVIFFGVILGLDAVCKSINQVALNGWLFEVSNLSLRRVINNTIIHNKLSLLETSDYLNKIRLSRNIVENETLPLTFHKILELAGSLVSFFSISLILVNSSILLCIISIFSTFPVLLSSAVFGKRFFGAMIDQLPKNRKLDTYYGYFFASEFFKELRVNEAFGFFIDKWSELDSSYKKELSLLKKKESNMTSIFEILKKAVFLLSLISIALFYYFNMISVSNLVISLITFSQLQTSSYVFFRQIANLNQLIMEDEKLLEFLNIAKNTASNQSIAAPIFIDVENVYFQYPDAKRQVIKNISFSLKRGERIGIVGVNGSGKTTLAKLILGIFEPDSGEINICGKSTRAINRESYYSMTGIVTQPVPIIPITVREYLCAGHETYTDTEVADALKLVGLEFLADSLDSFLTKEAEGIELSGGQWQRLAIAACVIRKPALFILDEPTSALDPIEESNFAKIFMNISSGRSAIIITHRMGVCSMLDKILVMSDGEIIEQGTHKELMRAKGIYSEMFLSQKSFLEHK